MRIRATVVNRIARVITRLWARIAAAQQTELERRYLGVQFWGPQENISIGERVSLGHGSLLSADSPVTIGSDSMIAARVVINTATHDPANHPMWAERISRPIDVGEHVWVGTGAIILPGVRIGAGAVVGAGSVVTRDVPELAVVAGVPARVLRYRTPGDLERLEYPGGVREVFLGPIADPDPAWGQAAKGTSNA